ncbi:hypothetical protein A9264_13570 [Vibrio sp. UCD-FRSSP16_10]|uniref:alpha/beta fold hydrolase n=1 Tax=Vibrio sp. UCD-FRSSP16_10 TaxID=1853257 RepID=UPI0007FBDD83|nr:alpha/beta fold hydrolase [Vibrio sp. UCD-FRSSP16_10]OBT20089.1 hypothetical protein A9264_13570 [Vibrio sp. UCD-FRSSP16_10]
MNKPLILSLIGLVILSGCQDDGSNSKSIDTNKDSNKLCYIAQNTYNPTSVGSEPDTKLVLHTEVASTDNTQLQRFADLITAKSTYPDESTTVAAELPLTVCTEAFDRWQVKGDTLEVQRQNTVDGLFYNLHAFQQVGISSSTIPNFRWSYTPNNHEFKLTYNQQIKEALDDGSTSEYFSSAYTAEVFSPTRYGLSFKDNEAIDDAGELVYSPYNNWQELNQKIDTKGLPTTNEHSARDVVKAYTELGLKIQNHICNDVIRVEPSTKQSIADVCVPESDTDSSKVNIHYIVMKAQQQADKGALFFNYGGPGEVGVDELVANYEDLPQEIRDHFDVFTIDPRGTGNSAYALNVINGLMECQGKGDECNKDLYLDLAPHISTNRFIHDIDSVRKHLGYEQITLYGYSYGTRVAAAYAAAYPNHFKGAVLDSPVRASYPNYASGIKDSMAEELAILDSRSLASPNQLESLINNHYQELVSQGEITLDGERFTKEDIQVLLSALTRVKDNVYNRQLVNLYNNYLENPSGQTLKAIIDVVHPDSSSSTVDNALVNNTAFVGLVVDCVDEQKPIRRELSPIPDLDKAEPSVTDNPWIAMIHEDNLNECPQLHAYGDGNNDSDPLIDVSKANQYLTSANILIVSNELDTNTPHVWADDMANAFGASKSSADEKHVQRIVTHQVIAHALGLQHVFEDADAEITSFLLDPENYQVQQQDVYVPPTVDIPNTQENGESVDTFSFGDV